MRGSTPLDVAAASVMDNIELALALREPDLEKVSLHSVSSMLLFNILHYATCVYIQAWTILFVPFQEKPTINL